MDQAKIGAFIAARRKELGLTQAQLAQRLAVTDKAVSKWETGRGLPDASLFEPLCGELGVSLGELFAGERVPPADLTQRTEQAAIGLIGLLQEWTRQRKLINAAFGTVLALDIFLAANELFLGWTGVELRQALHEWIPTVNVMLIVTGAAFARHNRDSRPIQAAQAAVSAVLLVSAVTAFALCAASGTDWYRATPLYNAGLRAGYPCSFLFLGFFLKDMPSPELFFLLMAILGLAGLADGIRSLRALSKK